MSNEILNPSEDNSSLSLAQKTWLINELAKTDNRTELKNKYKRIFGKVIPDVILASLTSEYEKDIAELKSCVKAEIDSHEFSSAYFRIEKMKGIYEMCIEGYINGITEVGPVLKQDPQGALAALKAIREEKQTEVQNELKLLQILVQSNRLTTKTGPVDNSQVTDHVEDETVTTVQVKTDNDIFFPGE